MRYGDTEPEQAVVTDEELQQALSHVKCAEDVHPTVKTLLDLVVDRLIETSTVFNEHEHVVSGVCTENDEYRSAGSGRTGAPAFEGGYGCERTTRIGVKPAKGF